MGAVCVVTDLLAGWLCARVQLRGPQRALPPAAGRRPGGGHTGSRGRREGGSPTQIPSTPSLGFRRPSALLHAFTQSTCFKVQFPKRLLVHLRPQGLRLSLNSGSSSDWMTSDS